MFKMGGDLYTALVIIWGRFHLNTAIRELVVYLGGECGQGSWSANCPGNCLEFG